MTVRRICKYCGLEYDGDPGGSACPACVAKIRSTSVRPRTCVDCGARFDGGPSALRCPVCRAERKRELDRRRRKQGTARPLGTTDLCQVCGQPYVVTGGLQKYCPACAETAIRDKDRAKSLQWNRDNTTPELRREERQKQTAALICVVCGKPFVPDSRSRTCSPECSSQLAKRNNAAWESRHRLERNAYRKAKTKSKESAMTPEEYRSYREEINAKARAAYARRKSKNNST